MLSIVPVAMKSVAPRMPVTAGMPYSRATVAAWLRRPPVSTTTPAAGRKSGVQGASVTGATRISPGRMVASEAPSALRTTRARPRV